MPLVVFCGAKQSGKSTAAKAIFSSIVVQNGLVPKLQMLEDGKLFAVYKQSVDSKTGENHQEGCYIDPENIPPENEDWFRRSFDPYVKCFSIADELKNTACDLFGLNKNDIRGDNNSKNKECHVRWKDMLSALSANNRKTVKEIYKEECKNEFMTNRRFLEVFGSFVCRNVAPNCHVNSCSRKIKRYLKEDPTRMACITDARFKDEIEILGEEFNDEVVFYKLLRTTENSSVVSEQQNLIPNSYFNKVIDNTDMDLYQKNEVVLKHLSKSGLLSFDNLKRTSE